MDEATTRETYQHVKNVVRAISAKRLRDHTQQENIEIIDVDQASARVFGHRLGLILIADGGNWNMIFKTYFNRQAVLGIAENIFKNMKIKNEERQVLDYMREFCNLTGGAIRTAFEDKEIIAGMSLPVMTRGYDEVFSSGSSSRSENVQRDVWKLKTSSGEIYCSISLTINEKKILTKLSKIEAPQETTADDGDLEFL